MEHLLTVGLGLGLAAACGFRVFVPLLVMSVASYSGHLELTPGFEWIGTLPALVTFATATVAEILAYYVPWVDNILDTVAGPAAVVAGAVVAASTMTEIDPFVKWSLAIIGGGGLAGLVKGTTSMARGASTLTTGGLVNPVLSTVEMGVSFALSLLAIVLPLLAMLVLLILLVVVLRKLLRWLAREKQEA